jgi:predicted transcriptional regulator
MATSKDYRGRNEIITQILQAISASGSKGIPRTLIMYKAFLSYIQLKEYLSVLVENGLIERFPQQKNVSSNGNGNGNGSGGGGNSIGNGNEKAVYRITERGQRFLCISQEIESLIGIKREHKDLTIKPDAISKL